MIFSRLTVFLVSFLCLIFVCSCSNTPQSSGPTSQPVTSGGPGSQPLWSSSAQGAILFSNSPLFISFQEGVILHSANSTGESQTTARSQCVQSKIAPTLLQIYPCQGDFWSKGPITLNFSAQTNRGKIGGVVKFTVIAKPPSEIPSCRPEKFHPPTGQIAFFKSFGKKGRHIFLLDPNSGSQRQLTSGTGVINQSVNYDFDGRISFISRGLARDGGYDFEIFRVDPVQANLCRSTFDPSINGSPSLNPAGNRLAWNGAFSNIFTSDLDGQNLKVTVSNSIQQNAAPVWCPNNEILFLAKGAILRATPGGGTIQKIPFAGGAVFSGSVNCCTDATGQNWITMNQGQEVMAAHLDGSQLTTLTPGTESDFSGDCTQITYLGSDKQIYRADFDGNGLSNIKKLTSGLEIKGSPSLQ